MTFLKRARRLVASSAVLLIGLSGAAHAQSQGSLGATSTGSVNINASVPNRTQISGLSDVSFANVDPTTTATSAQSVCVWSNTSTKGYNITATGSGTAGAFTLGSGALPVVPYSVQWNQSSGQSSGTAFTKGTALAGQVSTATRPTCDAGPASTASLVISIADTALQSMTSSSNYTGTLTLVVAPE